MPESLSARLAAGEALISGWVSLPEPLVAEAVARSGFDAVTLDMQHGMVDLASAFRQIATIRQAGSRAVVRIPVGEYQNASRLLDCGADAVIAPMIESVEDARLFGSFVKYPPLGNRSWGPTRVLQLHGYDGRPATGPDAFRPSANRECLAIAMIETRRALDALDDILALPVIDGVYLGPSDLSIALSGGERLDVRSPETVAAIEHVVSRAKAAGKPAGIFALSGELAKQYLGLGYQFITPLSDIGYIAEGARALLAEARG